jgi:RNA polymerase sigma-32 factor
LSKLPALVGNKSLTTLSPLQRYLQEIAKYPLLTPKEELELAVQQYDEGDRKAAQRMITANLRLVVKIANDFRRAKFDLLDLIQEGNYGLMQAVKKYNPYKGVKLSSYSAWWIRAYILKYLMDNHSHVKIATTASQRKLYYNLRKETQRLLEQYDRADPKLIANNLNVPEKDVIEMQKRLSSPEVFLDSPLGDDKGTHLDLLEDSEALSVDDLLADEQTKFVFKSHLEEFKKTLNERDLDIFLSRVLSETPLTLQEIGDKYSISRERSRQLEANMIKKLKKFVADKGTLDV